MGSMCGFEDVMDEVFAEHLSELSADPIGERHDIDRLDTVSMVEKLVGFGQNSFCLQGTSGKDAAS